MRKFTALIMLTGTLLITGCNTIKGAGQDVKSVGRVFSDDPDGKK